LIWGISPSIALANVDSPASLLFLAVLFLNVVKEAVLRLKELAIIFSAEILSEEGVLSKKVNPEDYLGDYRQEMFAILSASASFFPSFFNVSILLRLLCSIFFLVLNLFPGLLINSIFS
jgi:hypothetical protein